GVRVKVPPLAANVAARMGHPALGVRIKIPTLSQSTRQGWGTRFFDPAFLSSNKLYDEQNGCRQPGAPADAVVHRGERDCARSHHDSAGGGAVLWIAERIEGEPVRHRGRLDGDASGGLGA